MLQTRTRRSLFPHQKQILVQIKSKNAIGLFLEMRLGKTLLAIRWAMRFPAPRLVVAPLSVLIPWQNELELEKQSSVRLEGPRLERLDMFKNSNADWALINYEGLYLSRQNSKYVMPSPVATYPWSVVIIDESVNLKNPGSQLTKICCQYLSKAPHRAILSGLPNPENLLDFFEQFRFLDGHFLGATNYWQFRQTQFVPDVQGYRWSPKPDTIRSIKKYLKKRAVVLSRKKVGLDNVKLYQTRYVVLPSRIRAVYEKVERSLVLGDETTMWQTTSYLWRLRLAGGCAINQLGQEFRHNAKLNELQNILTQDLKKDKVLIWYVFVREGESIMKRLFAIGRKPALIGGEVLFSDRIKYQNQLKSGQLDTLCLQITVARYALDLSAASTAIYYSKTASADSYCQSLDRMIHPRKKGPVLAINILARDTVDEDIHRLLQTKTAAFEAILRRDLA